MIKNLLALLAALIVSTGLFPQNFEVAIDASSTSTCGGEGVTLTALPVSVNGSIGGSQQQGARPVVTVTFAENVTPGDFTIHKADLKYDKSFAYSIQVDDGLNYIMGVAFPLLEGGSLDGEDVPGLTYTDGCDNEVNFKMATAHYSWNTYNQNDMHDPANNYNSSEDGTITWSDIIELYQGGWGIYNHGFLDNGMEGGLEYAVMRNHSYTKRNTYNEIAGGINMNLFVIPASALELGDVALENGYNQILSNNYPGEPFFDVNNDDYYNTKIPRAFGLGFILSTVESLAQNAQSGIKGMGTTGMHELSMPDFRNAMEEIEQSYGKSGSDEIWFTTSEEVIQYLYVRDNLVVQETINGNTVTLTLQNDLPTDLRFYALSLLIDSEIEITNVEIQNGFNPSYNTSQGDSTLINLNWDEGLYKTPEELAGVAVTATEASQDSHDALIAMDYIEMIEDTITRDYFRAQLCAIPGISLPEGYCQGTSLYAIEWFENGQVFSTESTIEVTPQATSEYVATITKDNDSGSESIEITVSDPPVVQASAPSQACSDSPIQVSSEAENYTFLQWTTAGDGTFDQESIPEPSYTPGSDDILEGQVKLYTTAAAEGCSDAVDSVMIVFYELPEIFMEQESVTCGQQPFSIEIIADNATSVSWATSGDGNFATTSGTSTSYTPGITDLSNGQVALTATANSGSPCSYTISEEMVLDIIPAPTSDAGVDSQVCQSVNSIQLQGQAGSYSSVNWTSSGSGSFESNGLAAVYIPSEADRMAGQVVFTLNAEPISPCSNTISDEKIVTFTSPPEVFAGNDTTVCFDIYSLEGSAEGEGSFYWTTSGDGTFLNDQDLNNNYSFGSADLSNGQVTLTLHGAATGECEDENTSAITLTQVDVPEISAGENGEMCFSDTAYQLQGSISDTTAAFKWITQGDGSFSDTTILNPLYFPGPQELEQGSAYPGMRLAGEGSCYYTVNDDFMLLSIIPQPGAQISSDQSICINETAFLTGIASNYDSLAWNTTGDGSFENPNGLQTEYIPGTNDIINEEVKIYFSAFNIEACEAHATDSSFVFINEVLTADAGGNDTLCPGNNTFTCDPSITNAEQVLWATSGSGFFIDPAISGATYFISDEDRTNGEVTLYLEVSSSFTCNGVVSDSLKLVFPQASNIEAGENQLVCYNSDVELSASAEGASEVFWHSSGDGVFSDDYTLQTVYFPGENDIMNGSVVLSVTATANGPCQIQSSDFLVVTIAHPGQVEISASSENITGGEEVLLSAVSESYAGIYWDLLQGQGMLGPSYGESTFYQSVLADTLQEVLITAFSSGYGPCQNILISDTIGINVLSPNDIYAGEDLTTCSDVNEVGVEAGYPGTEEIFWSTSGDGTFADSTSLTTSYFPGTGDAESGQVTLTVASQSNPVNVSDDIEIFFNPPASVSLPDNLYGCSGGTVNLNATASGYSFFTWETTGDGIFTDTNNPFSGYIPGASDSLSGSTTLIATAQPLEGCSGTASDTAVLLLEPIPQVDAGQDQSVCEGENVLLDEATASGYDNILWQSSGSGTFSDNLSLNTVYNPSAEDYSEGLVTLTVMAFSEGYCEAQTESSIEVTFEPAPLISSLSSDTSCYGSAINIFAEAQYFSSISWTSLGSGTFNDNSGIIASYVPSDDEISQGFAEIMAVAPGLNTCSDFEDTAYTSIVIVQEPFVDAGEDRQTCGSGQVNIFGQTENGMPGSSNWTSSGDGFFENPLLENTTYHPGQEDVNNGSVILTLEISSASPCNEIFSDDLILTIHQLPDAPEAPSGEEELCRGAGEVVLETQAVENATSYHWVLQTPSAGYLVPDSTGTTNVLHLDEDYTGFYQVRVQAINDCGAGNLSEAFEGVIRRNPEPEISAYPSSVVCYSETIQLEGTFMHDSLYQWSPGNFPDTSVIVVDSSGHINGNKTMYLAATNIFGCQASDSIDLHFTICTGIERNPQEAFKVWPVPSDEYIFISYHKNAEVGIFNQQGKALFQKRHPFNNQHVLKVDVRSFPTGVYFVRLKGGTFALNRKIVVIK